VVVPPWLECWNVGRWDNLNEQQIASEIYVENVRGIFIFASISQNSALRRRDLNAREIKPTNWKLIERVIRSILREGNLVESFVRYFRLWVLRGILVGHALFDDGNFVINESSKWLKVPTRSFSLFLLKVILARPESVRLDHRHHLRIGAELSRVFRSFLFHANYNEQRWSTRGCKDRSNLHSSPVRRNIDEISSARFT